MAKRYTVFVDDNFHYMDESERYSWESSPTALQRWQLASRLSMNF
jgi:hypothetical protein